MQQTVCEQDYSYHVMCKTSTEQYIVPIFARGPRAILDFPDEIVFPVVAVKDSVSKTILVRSVGDRTAEIVLAIDECESTLLLLSFLLHLANAIAVIHCVPAVYILLFLGIFLLFFFHSSFLPPIFESLFLC